MPLKIKTTPAAGPSAPAEQPPAVLAPPAPQAGPAKPAAEDRIAVDTEGAGNAIAAGRGARAWVVNISGRWWLAAVLLVVFIAVLGLVLWRLSPQKPKVMNGLFNVAVSSFQVIDINGKVILSQDGFDLADFIQKQIQANFQEMSLEKVVTYDVWGPDLTGAVGGNTSAELEQSAKTLAEKIKATVLIYGVITSNGAQSRFEPKFYVNHQSFHEADEITGENQLGTPLRVTLPFSSAIQPVENPALAGRANALDMITIGLAYYSVDDFENARVYFQKAADDKHWLDSAGKEVVYLLLGNTNVRESSKEKDPQYLPTAAADYSKAQVINPGYGRALVGQANVLYMQAIGDPSGKNIDQGGLAQTEMLLDQAMELPDQPTSANIEAKVRFLRGQVDLTRMYTKLPGGDWTSLAKAEFNWIVQHYEAGDKSLATLVSHSYARLGTLAYMAGDLKAGVDLIRKGIDLSSPFYSGEYTAWLADIYASAGQKDQAIQAYQDAISIAQANSDEESVKRYSDRLKQIKGQ